MSAVPVMISKGLYADVENRIKSSNGLFKTVEEYITFVLTEVVKEETDNRNELTLEEEEVIKNRLRNLGYI